MFYIATQVNHFLSFQFQSKLSINFQLIYLRININLP